MKNGCDESETTANFRAHRHQINFPTINNERVKLFGRNKELKRLRKCHSDLMQSPTNNKAAVFVSGVRGVGKTALIEEFLLQPFNRRRTAAGHFRDCRLRRGGNNNSSSQLHSVIRCTFSEDQDDYQSWDYVYRSLREIALKLEADGVCGCNSSSHNIGDIEDEIFIEPQTETDPNLDDIPTSLSKESIIRLLSITCNAHQQQPLILFLDDCQHMNSMSLEVLSHLLFDELSLSGDLFIVCAYSSTSNASSQATTAVFYNFLDRANSRMNHQILDASMMSLGGGVDKTVEVMNIYPFALDVVIAFIAECSNRREMCEVTSLAEVIYAKTIGIISYVRSALNELAAKGLLQNLLRVDDSTLALSWIDDQTVLGCALPNYMSSAGVVDNVIHSIHAQIKEQLSLEIQRVLTMMACMPNLIFHASMLCELLYLEETDVRGLLHEASNLLRISSSSNLTVSFSHGLIRQALLSPVTKEERNDLVVRVFNAHFRKWREKRMHVGEGKKVPKLRKEMIELVAFFNIIDPSSPLTDDANMSDLADSIISRNSNISAVSENSNSSWESRRNIIPVSKSLGNSLNDGRRRAGVRRAHNNIAKSLSYGALRKVAQAAAMSVDATESSRENAAFSEITNNDASTNPVEKMILGKPEQDSISLQLCPMRKQNQALEGIFFPFISDPKSVLVQHGSVCFNGKNPSKTFDIEQYRQPENERELMVFSQGFIVADFTVGDSCHLMMALSDGDVVTQQSMLEYLQAKLSRTAASICHEEEEISTASLRGVLNEIAWPKYENVIRYLDPDNKGQIDRKELFKGLENIFSLPLSPCCSKERSAQFAALFSSVARVDCLDISHSRDARSITVSQSSLAERSFAITLNDREGDLIFTCFDQNHRDLFVTALRNGVIRSIEKSSSPESILVKKKRGWQHLVVRDSPICFVIENDVEKLESILESSRDIQHEFEEIRFKLNELDANGYAAIHYASLLGHSRCIDILIEKADSNASMLDVRGLSPKDLACNDEVTKILEKRRGRRSPLLKSRPCLSRGKSKQSSFRRLKGSSVRLSVSFADTDESCRSLDLFASDSDSEGTEKAQSHTASMPNIMNLR